MKKTAIIIVAVILIALAVFYYMNPGKNILESVGLKKTETDPLAAANATKEDVSGKTPTTGSFVASSPIVRDSNGFPLQQGVSGSLFRPDKSVKDIQKALNELHGTTLKVDGIYGPKTARALSTHGFPALVYLDDYYEILGV
jgi:hypothetical protein